MSVTGHVKISIHPRDGAMMIGAVGRSAGIGARRNMFLLMVD
jgi:hypothetical protein